MESQLKVLIGSFDSCIGILNLAGGVEKNSERNSEAYWRMPSLWQSSKIQKSSFSPAPSWLALNQDKTLLFAVEEVPEHAKIHSYQFQEGPGERLSSQSTGAHPCHILNHEKSRSIWVSNYMGGTVTRYRYDSIGRLELIREYRHQGKSGPQKDRQEASHPHSCLLAPGGHGLYCADLGFDRIFFYPLDENKETRQEIVLPSGAGPRHMCLSRNQKCLLVICELSSEILSFRLRESEPPELVDSCSTVMGPTSVMGTTSAGTPRAETTSTGTPNVNSASGNTCSEVALHPRLNLIYAANRGADTLFSCSLSAKGRLTPLAEQPLGGKWPRHFAIHPDGNLLITALQESNRIELHSINPHTGALGNERCEWEFPQPSYIGFLD